MKKTLIAVAVTLGLMAFTGPGPGMGMGMGMGPGMGMGTAWAQSEDGAGTAAEAGAGDDGRTSMYRLLNLFGDVLERVRADYVEKPSDEDLIESAINGMLTALDPHSSYLNAKNYREMQVQTRGEFGGLGIQVTMENGLIKVISPIEDTPAFRAGIEPLDLISHLDGEAIRGLTLQQAVDKMRGPVGTDIVLTIVREGHEPFDVTLTRAIITITSVKSQLHDKVGYIRITSFNEQTDTGVKKAIDDFATATGDDLQGIILDLRRNPGGLLDQAVAVADQFLDKGEIVSTRSRRPEDTQRFNAREGDLARGKPMVVLINEGSASASEIVAGALQDHRRAILMGTKSFGKGSVQTVIPLAGHGAMRLTTAKYYTPSGRSIQQVGIEPDILVPQAHLEPLETSKGRREADLPGALTNDGDNGDKADHAETGDDPDGLAGTEKAKAEDYQLARALDLLRALDLFSGKAAAE